MRLFVSLVFITTVLTALVMAGLALVPLPKGYSLAGTTLVGVAPLTPFPDLTLANFRKGDFQKNLEVAVAQRLGRARDLYIRVGNLLDYLSWRSPNSRVVIGRNKVFFTREHLYDYCWHNDTAYIRPLAEKIRNVSDYVRQQGKAFVFVISPNKAVLMPEYVPDFCLLLQQPRASQVLTAALREMGVPVINTEEVLLKARAEGGHPAFGPHGQHWNDVGQYHAVSEIVKMFEGQLGRKIADLSIVRQWADTSPRGDENDTERHQNLPIELRGSVAHMDITAKVHQPISELLVVGTSFSDRLNSTFAATRVIDRLSLYNYARWVFRLQSGHGGRTQELETKVEEDLPATFARSEAVLFEIYAAAATSGHVPAFADAIERLKKTTGGN